MTWDPTQYLKFAGERLQPAIDLLQRIPLASPAMVVDMGCGAGNLTPLFRARWPDAKITGVDSSPEMLAKARAQYPQASYVEASFAEWRPPEPVDLLYSNAALHWLGDHETLFLSLFSIVKPGGYMAVQMPRNFAAPSHTNILAAAEAGPWAPKLLPLLRRNPVAEPGFYWRLLHGKAAELHIWETEYTQVLSGENPVAEFTKGSALKPLLDALGAEEGAAFEADYRARIAKAYPKEANGSTLFPFRRLFILARA